MAKISIKTDFKDGDKLFAVQLNNNFKTIQEAWDAVNGIVWQGDDNEDVIMYKGTTEEIENKSVINGQVIWNTDTGEMYLDANDQRINTGSGNTVTISEIQPAADGAHKIWLKPSKMVRTSAGGSGSVVDSMEGNFTDKSPSVHAVKEYISAMQTYSTNEFDTGKIWIDGKHIYSRVFTGTIDTIASIDLSSINYDMIRLNAADTFFTYSNGDEACVSPIYYNSSRDYIDARIYLNGGGGILMTAGAALTDVTYNVVIEYTKEEEE